MSRPIRIEYPGALYHVMSHGAGKQWLYGSTTHLTFFINGLLELKQKYGILIHAAILMKNHYHLLIETQEANLSRAMRRFNTEFSRKINFTLKRKGPIFQKRYKAVLIEKKEYFMNLIRYLAQNPVRTSSVRNCEDYPGSFLNWITDKEKRKAIYWNDIRAEFGGGRHWVTALLDGVNGETEPSPYKSQIHTIILGNKYWAEKIRQKFPIQNEAEKEGSMKYRGLGFSEERLHAFLTKFPKSEREEYELQIRFAGSGNTISEIKEIMGEKSYHSVAQRLYRIRLRMKKDSRFCAAIEEGLRYVKC